MNDSIPTWAYFLFAAVCLVLLAFMNNSADSRCIEKGGQIIHNSTRLNHSCILPAGVK